MKNRRIIIWKYLIPGLLSLGMVVACYFYWNMRFTFGYGDNQIRRISMVKHLLFPGDGGYGDVLAINVSYDRTLVPFHDEMGIPIGDIDITDRVDMLRLMDSLSRWDNYRYIVCDVHFDTTITTDIDSLLFHRIASMRDIVVATSEHNPSILKDKLACAEYDQLTRGNRFVKYRFFAKDGSDSVPLRMWKDMEGGNLSRNGILYRRNGRLAVNSVIPNLDYYPRMGWDDNGEKQIWNLGADILEEPMDMAPLFQDKIVLIGDWAEYDIHHTIRGPMPGTAIVYNAYLSLKKGANRIQWLVILVLFLSFAGELSYAFRYFWKECPEKSRLNEFSQKYPLLDALARLLASWLGYTGILWIVCTVIYLVEGFFVNAFIVGSIIAFVSPYLKRSGKK